MKEAGLLEQDRERNRYRLGLKLFEFGNIVLANMDLHREARPFVDALTRLTGQVVHLAMFDGRQAVVVHRSDPSPDGSMPATFIESAPTHCTGVGVAEPGDERQYGKMTVQVLLDAKRSVALAADGARFCGI
jgi:DNA-binding IclR family transcriptional regulator